MGERDSDSGPLIFIAILVVAGILGLLIIGGVVFFLLFASAGSSKAPMPVPAQTSPVRTWSKAATATGSCFEVTITCPGASPEGLDRSWREWLPDTRRAEVVRTVSEQGKLRLYLFSSDPARAIEDSISVSQNVPADLAEGRDWLSVAELSEGLPPKPAITMVPQLVFDVDYKRAAALGISAADINRAVRGRGVADIEALRNTTLKTPTGGVVRLEEMVRFSRVTGPSHIIKDVR